MKPEEIRSWIAGQKAFFRSGETLDVAYRIAALKQLKAAILSHEEEIQEALRLDLGKSSSEGYMCEVGMTVSEISYMLSHLRRFAAPRRVPTPLAQFAARSYVQPSPYGVTLIMSPWNYPFLLTMEPLVDAIAAGNTAVVKPSAYSPHTSAIIARILEQCFDRNYVAVVTGGRAENSFLLEAKFDYIFFTGSQTVGREVLRAAAPHLTPVTLELGGKSPCIVDETANIPLAARRIVFGKFLNCGQTCVAPDYILCHESVKPQLLEAIRTEITRQFGENPLDNSNYGKIINEKHFARVSRLIDPKKIWVGGNTDPKTLRITPTVLTDVTWEDPVMAEEIFGPVLPVLTYSYLDSLIEDLQSRPSPLALYLFSENKGDIRRVTTKCRFGGGCINDTIMHLATSAMGFGGVGESGMGAYHGKTGFDTFSHLKSILDKKTWMDLPMRYQPYNRLYDKLIRIFLR